MKFLLNQAVFGQNLSTFGLFIEVIFYERENTGFSERGNDRNTYI
jgi:hypothetical protein